MEDSTLTPLHSQMHDLICIPIIQGVLELDLDWRLADMELTSV